MLKLMISRYENDSCITDLGKAWAFSGSEAKSYNCPRCYGLINKNLPFEPYIIGNDKLHYHLDCYDPKIRKLPRIDTTLISDKGNRLIFSGNLNNTISKKY